DLKESTAVERLRGGRTERAFTAWNKTRRALYVIIPEKAIAFRRGAVFDPGGMPRQTRDLADRPIRPAVGVRTSIRAGPARRRPRASGAFPGRRRGRAEPCRNWCRAANARPGQSAAPSG